MVKQSSVPARSNFPFASTDDIHRTQFLDPRVLSCKQTGVEPVPQGEPRSDRADTTIRATQPKPLAKLVHRLDPRAVGAEKVRHRHGAELRGGPVEGGDVGLEEVEAPQG